MPGPEDYDYAAPEPVEFAGLPPEVSAADSNPAFYPAEAKSEALRTEEEKAALAEAEKPAKGDDVKDGTGETVLTKEDVEAPQKAAQEGSNTKSVPASKSKGV